MSPVKLPSVSALGVRERLVMLIAVTLLPVLAFMMFTVHGEHRRDHAGAQASARVAAQQAADRIDDYAAMIGSGLGMVALEMAPLMGKSAAVEGDLRLKALMQHFPVHTLSLFALGLDGRPVHSTAVPVGGRPKADFSGRAAFRQAASMGKFSLEAPVESASRSGPYGVAMAPMLSADGRTVAIVGAAFDLARLNQFLDAKWLPMGGTMTVIRSDGIVLARSSDSDRWVGQPWRADAAGELSGEARANRTGWRVEVSVPAEVALADARKALWRTLVLIGSGFLLALAFAWQVARSITLPLLQLREGAGRLASGEVGHRVVPCGPVELRDLTGDFNRMAKRIGQIELERQDAIGLLRQVVVSSPIPMNMRSGVDGPTVEANDAFCAMGGFSREQIMGNVPSAQSVWPSMVLRSAFWQRVRAEGSVTIHTRLRRASGVEFDARVSGALIEHGGRLYTIFQVADLSELTEAQEALRATNQRLDTVFRDSPQGMFINDLRSGRFLDANAAALARFAYTREQLIGHTPQELGIFADAGQHDGMLLALRERKGFDGLEWTAHCGDGSYILVLASGRALCIDGSWVVLSQYVDLTERKRVESALQKSREDFQNVFEHSPQPCVISDEIERTWVDVNDSALRLFGFSREECIGRNGIALGMWPYPGERDEAARRLREQGMLSGFEVRNRTKDGRILDLLLEATFIERGGRRQILWQMVDITERKRAENELRRSRESFQIMFRQSPQPCSLTTVDDARFREVNEAWLRLYGRTRDEVIGRSSVDLGLWLRQEDRDEWFKALRETGGHAVAECRTLRSDGTEIDVLLSVERILIEGETLLLWQPVDITERKRFERAIGRLNEELELRVAQRTRELSATNQELESFSYSVAHDLRAPLRAIDGFSNILATEYPAAIDENGRRYIARIHDNVVRMSRLIDDLLALAQAGRHEMQSSLVDVRALALAVAGELQSENPSARIDVGALPQVTGDTGLLRQVLHNLVANALKFSAQSPQPHVEIGFSLQEGGVIYSCRDNGVGFDMRYADKLFGVFERLHSARDYSGTGVGLAIVHRIVQRHRGRVWAESTPGAGATFYVELPL